MQHDPLTQHHEARRPRRPLAPPRMIHERRLNQHEAHWSNTLLRVKEAAEHPPQAKQKSGKSGKVGKRA